MILNALQEEVAGQSSPKPTSPPRKADPSAKRRKAEEGGRRKAGARPLSGRGLVAGATGLAPSLRVEREAGPDFCNYLQGPYRECQAVGVTPPSRGHSKMHCGVFPRCF